MEENEMKGQTYVILGFIVLIIVAVFAVTNVETVKVNYLFWTGESPLILVILFSVLMGGLITAAVGSMRIIHLQRKNKLITTERDKFESLLKQHGIIDEHKEATTINDENEPRK